ncbi:MAG: hypothetical protein QME66_07625 [Candidatus Eisenbacteria bacterium]|nr:hypothetical protein [Candidatus Eisenbacteria bacterium]
MSPYLCAIDPDNNLWFITSAASGYGSHNGLLKLTHGETTAVLVDEFPLGSLVVELTGIAVLARDVFVSARVADGGSYIIRYRSGSRDERELFPKSGQTGYETAFWGIDVTTRGYLFAGVTAPGGSGLREFDFTERGRDGAEVLPRPQGLAPGGAVKDISVLRGRDYNLPGSFILSSCAGSGVCMWRGGTALDPSGYVAEPNLVLTGSFSPNGVVLDPVGNFFACCSGGGNVWARFFNAFGHLLEMFPDPGFESPSDVALTKGGDFLYVIDQKARKIFFFEYPVAIEPVSWGSIKALFKQAN